MEASLARVGTIEVQTVQTMLPVNPTFDFFHHLQGCLNVFEVSSPDTRTPVRITIDTGDSDAAAALIDATSAHMTAIPDAPVEVVDVTTDDGASVVPDPPTDDDRIGPPHHRATVRALLVEWSLTSLGWTTELVSHALSRAGADQNVLISIGMDNERTV